MSDKSVVPAITYCKICGIPRRIHDHSTFIGDHQILSKSEDSGAVPSSPVPQYENFAEAAEANVGKGFCSRCGWLGDLCKCVAPLETTATKFAPTITVSHGAPPAATCDVWPGKSECVAPIETTAQTAAPEDLAQLFHEIYEQLAPQFGYETRPESAKPWAEVPEKNRKLMTAVCSVVLDKLQRELTQARSELEQVKEELRQANEEIKELKRPPHMTWEEATS